MVRATKGTDLRIHVQSLGSCHCSIHGGHLPGRRASPWQVTGFIHIYFIRFMIEAEIISVEICLWQCDWIFDYCNWILCYDVGTEQRKEQFYGERSPQLGISHPTCSPSAMQSHGRCMTTRE